MLGKGVLSFRNVYKKGVLHALEETMQHLSFYELVGALSLALDMTKGQPGRPSLRCAWIGMAIARDLKLTAIQQQDLYCAILLADLGGKDAVRHSAETNTPRLAQSTYVLLSQIPIAPETARRFELADSSFQRSRAQTLRRLRFNEDVIASIFAVTHSRECHDAVNRDGDNVRLYASIVRLVKDIDAACMRAGRDGIKTYIRMDRQNDPLDASLMFSLTRIVNGNGFWQVLFCDDISVHLRDAVPAFPAMPVDDDYLDLVAAAFGCVMDIKRADTAGHSRRVALYVDLIADRLGFDPSRRRHLHRSAFLHDLGKLGISDALLNKPGKLSHAEWVIMRKHAGYTEEIIAGMEPFVDLARIAGAHHERLDGKGYPRGLTAMDISLESRIITVADIFDAISAERAYRSAIPIPQALEMMGRLVGTALDPRCMDALRSIVAHKKAAGVSTRKRTASFTPLLERWT